MEDALVARDHGTQERRELVLGERARAIGARAELFEDRASPVRLVRARERAERVLGLVGASRIAGSLGDVQLEAEQLGTKREISLVDELRRLREQLATRRRSGAASSGSVLP